MKKVLVANRGEIACRIFATCRKLGLKTVAVYSEADAGSLHATMADEAVAIGPARAAESYLVIDNILAAARETSADAIHPGYGFLAENGDFADAVEAAGLTWIGPSGAIIRAMGDKGKAREIAEKAGVPVLPGSRRLSEDDLGNVHAIAEQVGYPLLVKAVGGGGGIGMQRVDSPADLERKTRSTQEMAKKLFADEGVYYERLVERPRHVEVQVFGFGDGGGVHIFDRDCSVQRRYQKIIEEAPAPGLPDHVRETLYTASLALVRAVKYRSLGTVEFLYEAATQSVFFLEMNTRIQVEHPVTELISGIDLVAWQLEEASGEGPRPAQEDIKCRGAAVEARLYAERPEKKFLPSPGRIERMDIAKANHVRVDTGMRSGDTMTPFYDPMIAKIIAGGPDRTAAIDCLVHTLSASRVEGLHTNREFLISVFQNASFRTLDFSTRFVEEHGPQALMQAAS